MNRSDKVDVIEMVISTVVVNLIVVNVSSLITRIKLGRLFLK